MCQLPRRAREGNATELPTPCSQPVNPDGSCGNPIRMVLNGGYPPGTIGNPRPYGMPPFAQTLSDDEIAAVVTYIRAAWGNSGSAISARQANELRSVPLN